MTKPKTLPVIAIGKRGGKIVGYKNGKPVYQGSKAAEKLAQEQAQPTPVIPISEGYPRKYGQITHLAPGGEIPADAKWKTGYPGPGFKGEAKYKGKVYKWQFAVVDNRLHVAMIYPDGSKRVWDSPNKAGDSMYLFSKGLDLDMTPTEKKANKVSYPAKKAFGITQAMADLPTKPATTTRGMTAKHLKTSGEVPQDATAVREDPKRLVGRKKKPVTKSGKSLEPGGTVTVKKRGLGEVTLKMVAERSFEVSLTDPKSGKLVVESFNSLSAASDFVWVRAKGYESAAAYKKANNTNKVPSGGGWKFWGLSAPKTKSLAPEPLPDDTPAKPAPVTGPVQVQAEPPPPPPPPPPAVAALADVAPLKPPVEPKPKRTVKPKEKSPDGWDRMPEVERESDPKPKAVDSTKQNDTEGPEVTERYDAETAKAKMLDLGSALSGMQQGMERIADATGFSNSDMMVWEYVSSYISLAQLRGMLKKYRRQISDMVGYEEYVKLGLADPQPGWDRMPEEDEDLEATMAALGMSEGEKARMRALNSVQMGKLKKDGTLVLMGKEDAPLQTGDVVKVKHPDKDEIYEYEITGFGKSFQKGWGRRKSGPFYRYAYLKAADRAAPEYTDEDQDLTELPEEEQVKAALDKEWKPRKNRRGNIVVPIPVDVALGPDDVIKIKAVPEIEAGTVKITGMGGVFRDSSLGKDVRYVYVEYTDQGVGKAEDDPSLSDYDRAIKKMASGASKTTIAVEQMEDGRYRIYAPYIREFNDLVSNRGGNISGLTQYIPGRDTDNGLAARETFDVELVDEILEKAQADLGLEVVEHESVDKGRAALRAKREALRKLIPEVQAKLASGFKLYPYQNECVQFLDKHNGRALIGDEMGLGKTLQSLAWAAKENKKTLVVCPKVVRRTWIQEGNKFFLDHFKGKELDTAKDLRQGSPEQLRKALAESNLVTINYESLRKFEGQIREAGFDMIIVDESHRMKNPKAKQTQAIQRVAQGIESRVLLSGTAVKNKKHELFTQLDLVSPGLFKSADHIKSETIGGLWNKMQTGGYLARQKIRVLTDLPDKVTQIVGDEMPEVPTIEQFLGFAPMPGDEEYEAWLEDKAGGIEDLEETPEEGETSEAKLGIGDISRFRALLAEKKVPYTLDLVKETLASSDEQVIVFTESVDAAKRMAAELGDQAILHYGQMKHDDREAAKEEFQNPESPKRVFVTTRPSMAVGATLTRASQIVFNDLPWTAADVRQAEDRAHRVGQERNVVVRWVTATNSDFDQNVAAIVKRKYELSKKANEGKQLTAEEREWMEKSVTLEEAMRGTSMGVEHEDAPSEAGWDRFEDPTLDWVKKSRMEQKTITALRNGSVIRIKVDVPGGGLQVTGLEKRSDNTWTVYHNGEQSATPMEDTEVLAQIEHFRKTGGEIHLLSAGKAKKAKAPEKKPGEPTKVTKPKPRKPKEEKKPAFNKYKTVELPPRQEAWMDMLVASKIGDHDMAPADAAYRKFVNKEPGAKKPPPHPGGEMDALNEEAGKKLSGPLEGFYELLRQRLEMDNRKRGQETWMDVQALLPIFRAVTGFEDLRLPDYALDMIAEARVQAEQAEREAEAAGEPSPVDETTNPLDDEEAWTDVETTAGSDENPLVDDDEDPFGTPEVAEGAVVGGMVKVGVLAPEQLARAPQDTLLEVTIDADTDVAIEKVGAGSWRARVSQNGQVAEELTLTDAELSTAMAKYKAEDWDMWVSEDGWERMQEGDPEPEPEAAAESGGGYQVDDARGADGKYRYGMMLRPPSIGAIPKGEYQVEPPLEGARETRHGVIVYDRPLTLDEVESYELQPLLNQQAVDRRVAALVAEWRDPDYLEAYQELLEDDPELVRRQAADQLLAMGPGYFDLGPAVDQVLAGLDDDGPGPGPGEGEPPTPPESPEDAPETTTAPEPGPGPSEGELTPTEEAAVAKGEAVLDAAAAQDGELRLERSGDHIWGNRKDIRDLRNLTSEQLGEIAFDDAAELIQKKNLVPALDMETLRDLGMTPGTAHMVLAALNAVTAKPGDTLEERKLYLDKVRELVGSLTKVKTLEDFNDLRASYYSYVMRAKERYRPVLATFADLDSARSEWTRKLVEEKYTRRSLSIVKKGNEYQLVGSQRIKPSPLGARFDAFVKADSKSYRNAYRDALTADNAWSHSSDDPVEDGWKFLQERGDATSEAAEKTREARAKKKADLIDVKREVPETPERIGGRHKVLGADTDRTREMFNLREIDYGQKGYMTDVDRAFHVTALEGAMADLADTLGVDPQTLSFEGRLGIALGARGKGRALAHYERSKFVINITKSRGNGSLAHEWGHALDNILASVYRDADVSNDAGFVSRSLESLPPDIAAAVSDVMDAINKGDPNDPERAEALKEAQKDINDTIKASNALVREVKAIRSKVPAEGVPKAIERYRKRIAGWQEGIEKLLEKQARKHAKGKELTLNDLVQIDHFKSWISSTEQNIADLESGKDVESEGDKARIAELTSQIDEYRRDINRKKRDRKKMAESHGKSHFVTSAAVLGEYWKRPPELFARAFESYIQDTLEGAGRRNTYLVAGTNNPIPAGRRKVLGQPVDPYPRGEERKRINAAMEKLLDVLKSGGHLEKAIRAMMSPGRPRFFIMA